MGYLPPQSTACSVHYNTHYWTRWIVCREYLLSCSIWKLEQWSNNEDKEMKVHQCRTRQYPPRTSCHSVILKWIMDSISYMLIGWLSKAIQLSLAFMHRDINNFIICSRILLDCCSSAHSPKDISSDLCDVIGWVKSSQGSFDGVIFLLWRNRNLPFSAAVFSYATHALPQPKKKR